jgi:DNA-binding MarR family transcriptional regulator
MNDSVTARDATAGAPDKTIFELLHAAHALEDRVDDALAKAGLSMPKFAVLSELTVAGQAVSLSELATRLSCVKSNMTQLIDRLEADGLVQRVDDPSDRRAVKAAITPTGTDKYLAGEAEMAKLHEEFAASVGVVDRNTLARLMSALG